MKALQLESVVTIDCIPPGDRERMAQSLAQAAVVAAMSDYESHPVAVMEAVALGIPTVGLDTAGVGDLVRAGLVRGVPKQASPRMIAEVLVSALRGQRTVGPAACRRGTRRLRRWLASIWRQSGCRRDQLICRAHSACFQRPGVYLSFLEAD